MIALRIKRWAMRNNALLTPLLATFMLRLTLMLIAYHCTGTQVMTQGDTASYLEPGRNLFLHGSYTSSGQPELDRTPGYPIFAMLTGSIGGNVLFTILTQIIVSCLSMILIAHITKRVFSSQQAAVASAWLYALEPLGLIYTIRLMPETFFVALLLAMIERITAFLTNGKLSSLATAGILLATAT